MNKIKSKLVYLLFLIPIICILIMIGIFKHDSYVRSTPKVYEEVHIESNRPFWEGSELAKLDEISYFKLNDDLPVLDGATAFYPLYAAFVQAVYPEGKYYYFGDGPVLSTRTANAYKNLLEGKVDIIFCLEPSKTQLKQFQDRNMDIKLVPIGKEAFVFFVNKKNTINNLTIENILGIYSGRIKNWRKLNGQNERMLAYQRPKNSGSQTVLEKIMGDVLIIEPGMEDTMEGMENIINEVAVYRNFNNAIGFSFLLYTTEMVKNDQIKLLTINNIYPSTETIQDNTYPFIEYFYAIYNNTEYKNKNIEPFIEWILSKQGQFLVSKTGYVPINKE